MEYYLFKIFERKRNVTRPDLSSKGRSKTTYLSEERGWSEWMFGIFCIYVSKEKELAIQR